MSSMTDETKQKLLDAGRQDLIDIFEFKKAGYAGIDPKGTIVDRRIYPKAIPILPNGLTDTPEPKPVPKVGLSKMMEVQYKYRDLVLDGKIEAINGLMITIYGGIDTPYRIHIDDIILDISDPQTYDDYDPS